MGRDLRVGVISSYRCHVLGDSRPEQSSTFSDVATLSATAPDPQKLSNICLLTLTTVLRSLHQTVYKNLSFKSAIGF
ncbi:hypothetical protein SprV_0100403300 [Sparganum proliferum]